MAIGFVDIRKWFTMAGMSEQLSLRGLAHHSLDADVVVLFVDLVSNEVTLEKNCCDSRTTGAAERVQDGIR